MTVYTKSMMESLAEVRLEEDNMDLMRKAAGGAMQTIKMKDGKLQMDSFTASAIMQVYDKVNPANKKKIETIINSGKKNQMMKLQSMAMKAIKSDYDAELDEAVKRGTLKDLENLEKSLRDAKKKKDKKKADALQKELEALMKSGLGKKIGPDWMHKEETEKKYKVTNDKLGVWTGSAHSEEDAKEQALSGWGVVGNVEYTRNTTVEIIEEAELDEMKSKSYALAVKGKIVAVGSKADMMKLKKQKGGEVHMSPGAKVGDMVEEVETTEAYEVGTDEYRKYTQDITPGEPDTVDEDMSTVLPIIAMGSMALIPAAVGFAMIDDLQRGKLSAGLSKTVGNMISKFKKDKKYKPTSAEIDASKKLEKEIETKNPSLFKKVMAKVKSIKKEELDEVADRQKGPYVKMKLKGPTGKKGQPVRLQVPHKEVGKYKDKGYVVEASARADARRHGAMRGKEVDPADVDTDATDADIKAASKNIMMQMRKVISLGGKFDVEFLDKKKVKVKPAIANKFIQKYQSMRRPADKEKFQNQAAKSYKDLLQVLKASYMMAQCMPEETELDEALPPHLQKFFDKDGNPKSKEGKAAWERIKKTKMKGYTPKQIKMAIGVAFDKRYVQGNMTGAAKTIEKIAKGLSDLEPVRDALRRANENTILDRIDAKLRERKNG